TNSSNLPFSYILRVPFTVGLVFLSLGLVGSYLYRVFEASRKRPLYIVAKTSGFQSATQEVHDASKHGHKTTMYYARPSKNQVFE
ncbi:MAG: hypothetical protein ABF674_12020, partial [Lentilactobacillus hilgardii]